jgi:hypothetical protein
MEQQNIKEKSYNPFEEQLFGRCATCGRPATQEVDGKLACIQCAERLADLHIKNLLNNHHESRNNPQNNDHSR